MFSAHKNQAVLKILLHVFTWIVLLLFPFFLSQNEGFPISYPRLVKFTWIPLLLSAIIFYTNYFLLIENFLFKKRTLLFILINIGLVLFFTWVHFGIKDPLNLVSDMMPPSPAHTMPSNKIPQAPMHLIRSKRGPSLKLFIYKDIISLIIPIIVAFAVRTNEKWTKAETEKKEKEKDILDSELQHLKYQLQPHFFFNSLNTIYALIERSPSIAQETVHRLAKLMRYMLYETDSGKVSLNEEIEFMKQYIELMKLRLSDKTKVHVNFPVSSNDYLVTPLLFISLIENAFKHGISATQNSELFFNLNVVENKIRFYSENTNFPKNEHDKSGSGIGLLNLKKRLELAYPGRFNFQTKVEGNVFTALLEISTEHLPN